MTDKNTKAPTAKLIRSTVEIHPGEYLADEIEARKLTKTNVANDLGVSLSFLSDIIAGRRSISHKVAIRLEEMWNIPAEFWINLQTDYELTVIRNNRSEKRTTERRIKKTKRTHA